MRPRHVYLVLCVVGFLLPYSQFVPWLLEHGLNLSLFCRELVGWLKNAYDLAG
jgi:hypothetical protein